MTRQKSYSKVTKKGQVTIPVSLRKKYGLEGSTSVSFAESAQGLILKPMPDIINSAGSLARHAKAEDVLEDLIKTREEEFR